VLKEIEESEEKGKGAVYVKWLRGVKFKQKRKGGNRMNEEAKERENVSESRASSRSSRTRVPNI